MWAWGGNDAGQLGDGTTVGKRFPTQIGTDTDWVDVAGGLFHSMALKANGALFTWGTNETGQLGNGNFSETELVNSPTFIPVLGCTLDNEEFVKQSLTVSPNPASEVIELRYEGNEIINTLAIYDVMGRLIYTSTPVTTYTLGAVLPIANLQAGTYILTLSYNDKKIVTQRFVKR